MGLDILPYRQPIQFAQAIDCLGLICPTILSHYIPKVKNFAFVFSIIRKVLNAL